MKQKKRNKMTKELMKIELVNPIENLIGKYKALVHSYIDAELITLEEWNKRFKYFRDDCGYSMIHYLQAAMSNIDLFMTNNPIMLKNRKELMKRFGVKIITTKEFMEERKNEKK